MQQHLQIISGWWYTYPSEQYEFVNGKDYPIYEMENKTCLKPPTSVYIFADHTPGKIWHFNPLLLGPPCDGDNGHANFELTASCKMLAGTYAANIGSMDVCTYNEVWLVIDLPLWKIWKSIGVIIPNIWKNHPNVPNHQPDKCNHH